MLSPDLLIVIGVLVFQPLIALIWTYIVVRAILWYGLSRSGEWVDNRVSHAKEEITE